MILTIFLNEKPAIYIHSIENQEKYVYIHTYHFILQGRKKWSLIAYVGGIDKILTLYYTYIPQLQIVWYRVWNREK